MRFIFVFAILMIYSHASQSLAASVWERPAVNECGGEAGSKANKNCQRKNYCVDSSADACLAYVGERSEEQARSGLLEQCFVRKMNTCFIALKKSSSAPTNITNYPKEWNCINSDGSKADPTFCRRTNFCLDTAATICGDKIGSEKYTAEGQGRMIVCIKETETSCMAIVN